ncbi:MAG: aminotransferase class I/II-fold pyridoxal phosphate-dependent enzyme [Acidobacteriota bacterium]
MPEFHPFVMERMMSKYEQGVEYNLSESGVHPVRLGELLGDDPSHIRGLMATDLNYPHVNGLPELRENIAALYDGATGGNVLVTVGAAEANYITTRTLLSPGDEIVFMIPNYMQIWGIAKNHGFSLKTFRLREETGWAPDVAELKEAVTVNTKLIAVCSPNNPTGRVLTEPEMDAIVAIADRVGAWILADEVYSGAERLADRQSPSFYGRYDKVLAVGSMSKAYGLPGLRIGWVVGPAGRLDEIWARHEYTTISATMLSNKLAVIALSPEVRPRLIARARNYVRKGYAVLQGWIESHGSTLSFTAPEAGAIAFIRYHLDINSTVFMDRLRTEKSVLIVAGDHFGMDHFVRLSFGLPHDRLIPALNRIHEFVEELRR